MPSRQKSPNQIQRTVHFYRIYEQHAKEKILPAGELWKDAIESFFQSSAKYQEISKVRFQLYPGYDDLVVISMHKPIDLLFATQEDEDEGKYRDVTEEELESHKLAYASVAVVGEHNGQLFLAITKGGHVGAPSNGNFQELLNYALPLSPSSKWIVEGVLHPSDRARLKASQGVTAFSGTVLSHPSAGEIDGLEYGGPIEKLGRLIADYVGTEIELEISVSLKDYGREHTAKAKDLTLGTSFLTTHGRKPKATAQSMSGEELLTLVEHNFASKIYLDISEIANASFSVLLRKSTENFRLNITQALGSR